jgi:flagellar hook protein FlgE
MDLIPDNPPSKQLAGTVTATRAPPIRCRAISSRPRSEPSWRSTATASSWCRSRRTSSTAGPTFDGSDLYTRRGDFQTDKDGFLVNGAGYYLMGIPVDAKTGNLSGSVPQLLQVPERLPAGAADHADPVSRKPGALSAHAAHDTSVPGSELIDPKTFSANPVAGAPSPAKITGFGASLAADANAISVGTQILPGRPRKAVRSRSTIRWSASSPACLPRRCWPPSTHPCASRAPAALRRRAARSAVRRCHHHPAAGLNGGVA